VEVPGEAGARGGLTTSRGLAGEVFVGRERELAELREAGVASALAGRGRLFLLSGEPGVGKTCLAEMLSSGAGAAGMSVYWGRCWDGGGAPPYWPWLQVFRAYLGERDAEESAAELGSAGGRLAQIVPELQELLPGLEAPPTLEGEEARFALFDAVSSFVGRAARARPLLLVFDDLHAADPTSLLLLRFAARALRTAPVLMLGTYRDVELRGGSAGAEVIGDLAREGKEISLRGLSRPDVARFIEETTGGTPTEALVEAVHEASGGNPLFVSELVRAAAAEGRLQPLDAAAVRRTLPEGVRQAIGRRLDRLTAESRELLTVASIVGREFTLGLLEELTSLSRHELLERMAEAVQHRLAVEPALPLGRFGFSHDLVRETLYSQLAPGRRAEMHNEVGRALERIYEVDPEPHLAELAHHFLEGAQLGDLEKALGYSRRAGDRAVRQLAYEEAACHYERALHALEIGPASGSESWCCELLIASGDAWMKAGKTAQARDALAGAAALARGLGDPTRLARAALALAAPYAEAGFGDELRAGLLEEALAALPEEDNALRASVLARLAPELFWRHDFARADEVSDAAVEMARRSGDVGVLAEALDCRHYALMRPETLGQRLALADELVRLADATGAVRRQLRGRLWRIHDHLELGDLAAVDSEIDRHARLATAVRQPGHLWVTAYLRAMRAVLEGRLDEARRLAEEAFEIGRRAGIADAAAVYYPAQLYPMVRHQGGGEELEKPVAALAELYGDLIPGMRALLAGVHQVLGRETDARGGYERLATAGFDLPRDHNWLAHLWVLVDLCSAFGDSARAHLLYDLLLPYRGRFVVAGFAGACAGPVDFALARAAALMSRYEEAQEHFEAALQLNARIGARAYGAETTTEYASMLLDRGGRDDRERARELLQAAAATAAELGLTRVAERCAQLTDALSFAEPVFRREGDFWRIAYAGREVSLKDSKGLQYIAELLANPNTEIAAQALAAAGEGAAERLSAEQAHELGLRSGGLGDVGALLDAKAKADYRRRLEELRDELAEAESFRDPERVARAREELEYLGAELARATGLGGADRRAASPAERARINVTKTIKQSLKRIAEENEPLGRHLGATIRTGTFCCYLPGPKPPCWRL
jgi:hypothetical protein